MSDCTKVRSKTRTTRLSDITRGYVHGEIQSTASNDVCSPYVRMLATHMWDWLALRLLLPTLANRNKEAHATKPHTIPLLLGVYAKRASITSKPTHLVEGQHEREPGLVQHAARVKHVGHKGGRICCARRVDHVHQSLREKTRWTGEDHSQADRRHTCVRETMNRSRRNISFLVNRGPIKP